MKFLYLIFLSLILVSCKEAPTEPSVTLLMNGFPNNSGIVSVYKVSTTASVNVSMERGFRKSYILTADTSKSIEYFRQLDSTTLDNGLYVSTTYFRNTNAGLYYYVDTTGFSSLITQQIPDTVKQLVKFDKEFTILSFPLTGGKYWTSFSLSILNISLIELKASFIKDENLTLVINNVSQQITAKQILYEFKLNTDPFNPFGIETYSANAWYADGFGFVKFDGSSLVQGILSGSGISQLPENEVVSQSLIEFVKP